MELAAVFTRRAPETVSILTEGAAVCSVNDVEQWKDKIDVMILCGGSATDLPEQTPKYAEMFNVIDSFDTHARIPEHFANVDAAAKKNGHVGIISVGWDPGMFSLNRMYANAILPEGRDYTFWILTISDCFQCCFYRDRILLAILNTLYTTDRTGDSIDINRGSSCLFCK